MKDSTVEARRSATGRLLEIRWLDPAGGAERLRLAPDGRTVLLEEGRPSPSPVSTDRGLRRGTGVAVDPLTWSPRTDWDRPGTHTLRRALESRVTADDLGAVLDLLRGLDYR